MKYIAMVGSEIFWNGIALGASGEQSVSPMCRSAIPEIATMEPIPASLDFYFIQTVKLIKLADLYALGGVGIVMVDDDNLLIDGNLAIIHFADADSADVFVVVDGTDQHLQYQHPGRPQEQGCSPGSCRTEASYPYS